MGEDFQHLANLTLTCAGASEGELLRVAQEIAVGPRQEYVLEEEDIADGRLLVVALFSHAESDAQAMTLFSARAAAAMVAAGLDGTAREVKIELHIERCDYPARADNFRSVPYRRA